jgi:protein-tyrosine kinase
MSASTAQLILNEIRRLHEDKQSGVLALSRKGERVDVSFREGMIDAVSSNLNDQRLGDHLVHEGYLEKKDLDPLGPESRKRRILLGEAVVRSNLLYEAEVGTAVRAQAFELLDYVFNNGFLVESFTNSLRSFFAPARISFPHVLLELSRRNPAMFEEAPGVRIALTEESDLSGLPWCPEELCVLSELKHPSTFDDLLKASGLETRALRRILGVLQRLRVISVQTDAETSDPSGKLLKTEFLFEHLIPVVTNAALHEKLEVARNGSSFTSEQFRNLKVQISETNTEFPLKVFTISSPEPQDGKSFISSNLALTFAKDPGRRVIIVDCDLRCSGLDKYLGVISTPGLMQYLENGKLGPYCFVRRVENLYFMTAGGTASNPIEVLSMQKMKHLITTLRKDFDTVILDSPPYSPIADARIVTGLSDGLIMVLRRGKTSYGSTDRALKAVDPKKLLGVVFNEVKPMLFHTYHEFNYYNYGSDRPYSGGGERPTRSKSYLKS